MCYTCTYSLCKGCIKDADYLSVRGNNGLCGACMRTVMLIESLQGEKEAVCYLFRSLLIFPFPTTKKKKKKRKRKKELVC
jgi:hypothetical protein